MADTQTCDRQHAERGWTCVLRPEHGPPLHREAGGRAWWRGDPPKLSAKRAGLMAAMMDPAAPWEPCPECPHFTVRYKRVLDTPDWARTSRRYGPNPGDVTTAQWDEPTYSQLVFVTMTSLTSPPIVGTCRAPGGGRSDHSESITGALAIIADPVAWLERSTGQ
jgi:hypothetical protein